MWVYGCVRICGNNYSLLGDYVHGRIIKVLFVEMYVNVVFVKLFAQRSEFYSC